MGTADYAAQINDLYENVKTCGTTLQTKKHEVEVIKNQIANIQQQVESVYKLQAAKHTNICEWITYYTSQSRQLHKLNTQNNNEIQISETVLFNYITSNNKYEQEINELKIVIKNKIKVIEKRKRIINMINKSLEGIIIEKNNIKTQIKQSKSLVKKYKKQISTMIKQVNIGHK